MKKITILVLIAFLAISTFSCSNNDDDVTAPIVTPTVNGFTWTDSNSTNVQTVNNPYATAQYKTIFAKNTGGATVFEINLTSLAVGTYSLASANALYYKNATMSASFSPTSGTVTITANANNKLSGTFTATGTGGGITSVTGQFTNITVNP